MDKALRIVLREEECAKLKRYRTHICHLEEVVQQFKTTLRALYREDFIPLFPGADTNKCCVCGICLQADPVDLGSLKYNFCDLCNTRWIFPGVLLVDTITDECVVVDSSLRCGVASAVMTR